MLAVAGAGSPLSCYGVMSIFCYEIHSLYSRCSNGRLIALPAAADEKRTRNRDRDALIALENDWLKNEHNRGRTGTHIGCRFPASSRD